ncbi:putative leader peptide [Streptomyces sp. NPDC088760]|uniref:putative leader peptide n=1 Tax=Streptomyces sp. NPDC088760 TaxID=3365890 RepID=UPI0037FA1EBF
MPTPRRGARSARVGRLPGGDPSPCRPCTPASAPADSSPRGASARPGVRSLTLRPQGDTRLTRLRLHAVLRIVTDTCVRLWRRVHMDLVRYAGCVCRPSC